jgi:signal-transduction protein with cAMP-binding, CBS, and nucleotidyltransferase domain
MSLDFQKLQNDPLDETAHSALAKSCYLNIQWKISKTATVHDAIKLMANHDVGALAVTEGDGGEVVGIISERDYLKKIGVMGRTSKTTTVQEIATMGKVLYPNLTLFHSPLSFLTLTRSPPQRATLSPSLLAIPSISV